MGPVVKNLPANAGDARHVGSIPELARSPEVGNGNPLQHSCLEFYGGLPSTGLQRVGHDSACSCAG